MNYTGKVIRDFPYENPITKTACAIGVLWLGFIAINYAERNERLPERRKNRQALTSNAIDNAIDSRNRALGGKVTSNPSVPFYSRHNYNRRRRGKDAI